MTNQDLTCEEARALAEALLEGGSKSEGGAEIGMCPHFLKAHVAKCAACRARFGLDLALIEAIADAPAEAFPSVSLEVMARLQTRERRLSVLRWGVVISAASLAGIVVNAFGAKLVEYMYTLATRGVAPSGGFSIYTKLAGILKNTIEILSLGFLEGTLGADLSPYRAQIWAMAIGSVAVVLFIMYFMGLWLKKPRGVKSWLVGRSWPSGHQVW